MSGREIYPVATPRCLEALSLTSWGEASLRVKVGTGLRDCHLRGCPGAACRKPQGSLTPSVGLGTQLPRPGLAWPGPALPSRAFPCRHLQPQSSLSQMLLSASRTSRAQETPEHFLMFQLRPPGWFLVRFFLVGTQIP